MTMSFDQWWAELVSLAAAEDWPLGDPDGWLEYHADGDTPADALQDEMAYADGDIER